MRKKIILGLIILFVLMMFLVAIIFFIPIHSSNLIITKGNILFGSNYCSRDKNNYLYDYEHPRFAGQAFTPYKCKLCNQTYEHNTTAVPKICRYCSEITGRCQQCGKKQK